MSQLFDLAHCEQLQRVKHLAVGNPETIGILYNLRSQQVDLKGNSPTSQSVRYLFITYLMIFSTNDFYIDKGTSRVASVRQ